MTTLVSLARPRLARRVVAALREEHVVVLAPAGYGKSTLLRALALQHAGAQVVSLSLEDADIVHLQARLRPLLVQGATLLLDDVHHLQGAGESLAWLNDQLASSTSASTRFVLSGRLLPDATWRKRFVVFDADRLGFSPTEATALLSGLPGLTPQAIEQWRVRTRGWPLLLSVLVRQMDGLDDATQSRLLRSAGQVSDDDLLSYLAERMIRLLPRELFQFMQTMALPTQFSDALAADVLGASVSQAIALRDEVERRNLFIEPIAPDGWFKFHDFVREYLLNRAKRLSLAAFENNFARIVDWFEAHTDVPMAIEQALAGAVFERAARLMGTIAPTFVTQTGRYRTLQRWVMALPDSVLAAHPLLSMQLGLNLREMGRGWRETAWQHLNKALRDAAQHPDLEIQARVRLGVASGHIHEGEAAQALAIAHPMLDDTKLSASLRRRGG